MTSNRMPVLITAIGGGSHGEQILKALRLADGDRYYLVGADANEVCAQASLVDEFVTLPYANAPDFMDELLAVCERYEIRALFHGCEPELRRLSAERNRILDMGIFLPINPRGLIDLCMNKIETGKLLMQKGFSVPRFARARSIEELREIDWFPVVVKPFVGSGGSANVFIAQNESELGALATYLGLETLAESFVVQEYIGTPDEEYTVGVLHDLDGAYINSIAVRRMLSGQLNTSFSVENRTGKSEFGRRLVISSGVSHGEVGRFEEVTSQCKDIAAAVGAKGPINIQCRVVDGEVLVFEINPRFSGTTSIRAMVGYNEPDTLIRRHVDGESIEADFPYQQGTVLRGLIEYRVS